MKKIGRNDPCHCGSGKKFKKCCESKMIGGRYMASKIDTGAAPQVAKASNFTNLFHQRISAIAKPSQDTKPIKATGAPPAPAADVFVIPAPAASEVPPSEPPSSTEKVE